MKQEGVPGDGDDFVFKADVVGVLLVRAGPLAETFVFDPWNEIFYYCFNFQIKNEDTFD